MTRGVNTAMFCRVMAMLWTRPHTIVEMARELGTERSTVRRYVEWLASDGIVYVDRFVRGQHGPSQPVWKLQPQGQLGHFPHADRPPIEAPAPKLERMIYPTKGEMVRGRQREAREQRKRTLNTRFGRLPGAPMESPAMEVRQIVVPAHAAPPITDLPASSVFNWGRA